MDGAVIFRFSADLNSGSNNYNLRDFPAASVLLHLDSLGLAKARAETFVTQEGQNYVIWGKITPLGYDFVSSVTNRNSWE